MNQRITTPVSTSPTQTLPFTLPLVALAGVGLLWRWLSPRWLVGKWVAKASLRLRPLRRPRHSSCPTRQGRPRGRQHALYQPLGFSINMARPHLKNELHNAYVFY